MLEEYTSGRRVFCDAEEMTRGRKFKSMMLKTEFKSIRGGVKVLDSKDLPFFLRKTKMGDRSCKEDISKMGDRSRKEDIVKGDILRGNESQDIDRKSVKTAGRRNSKGEEISKEGSVKEILKSIENSQQSN